MAPLPPPTAAAAAAADAVALDMGAWGMKLQGNVSQSVAMAVVLFALQGGERAADSEALSHRPLELGTSNAKEEGEALWCRHFCVATSTHPLPAQHLRW